MADTTRKQLELVFKNEYEKEVTIIVLDPKDGLTAAAVAAAANTIITANIFFSTDGCDLKEFVSSQIRVLTVTELA